MDKSKLEALKRYYATQCGINATIELSTLRKLIALAERTTSPVSQAPVDLSKLTRYDQHYEFVEKDANGEFVKLSDVEQLLAASQQVKE